MKKCVEKMVKKRVSQKHTFFCNFWIFQVFARRFFVDFKGPGLPPGVILSVFLGRTFSHDFLVDFVAKFEKMEKVKCAENI